MCPDLMVSLSLRLPRGVGLRSSLAVEADGAGGRMRRRERSKPRRLQGSSSPKSRDDTGFPRNSCSPGAGKRGGGSRRARMRRRSRRRLSRPPMESVSHCRRRELRRRPRRSRRTRAPRRRASGAPIAAPCLRICRASRRLSTSRAKLARAVRAPARPIGNDDVLLESVKRHGLRKAGATRAAENGASIVELRAMFGWTSDQMPALYTKAADRARMAGTGMTKLERVGRT